MLGFTDSQLRTVWAAAVRVPVEKRGVFLERVVARLQLQRIAASRRRGLSRNRTPALLSATTRAGSSPMSISRKSRGEDRRRSCWSGTRQEGLQAVAFCSRSEKPLCCVDGSGRRKLEMSLLRTRAGLAEEP